MLSSILRIFRGILILALLMTFEHVICSHANRYTTQLYVKLATKNKEQYAVPLYDSFFDGERDCPTSWQTAYDLALWIEGFWVLYITFSDIAKNRASCAFEHMFITMFAHTAFMCLCQISTTLPASGGLQECLEANPQGINDWPWYGVSFITQSFAGGRACGDMIYSGHISNLVLLAIGGGKYTAYTKTHWFMSLVLSAVGCIGIVKCQDHYTVDCVLALGIATLLVTNTHLEKLAMTWASFNVKLEDSFVKKAKYV